jgi:uncharacterized membrane protein (Fun14 family)
MIDGNLLPADYGQLFAGLAPLLPAGIVGFMVGYAVKKVIRLIFIILGLFFVGIIAMQYWGILTMKWEMIYRKTGELMQQYHLTSAGEQNPLSHIIAVIGLPSAGVFTIGLYFGLRRG